MWEVPIQCGARGNGGNVLAVVHSCNRTGDEGKAECESNAVRIVGCVNAMAGIEDPYIFMAAVDEILNEAKQRGNRFTYEMVEAIKRLRSSRGQQTGG